MEIRHLDEIIDKVKGRPTRRLVAVNAIDDHTLDAVYAAVEQGIVKATLTEILTRSGRPVPPWGWMPANLPLKRRVVKTLLPAKEWNWSQKAKPTS